MELMQLNLSKPSTHQLVKRYGFAVLSLAAATLVRWWAKDAIGATFPYGTYYVAIIVTAGIAGWGPGLFTMFSGMLLGYWLFLCGYQFVVQIEIMRLALYLASGSVFCWIAGRMRSKLLKAHEHEKQRQHLLDLMGEGFAMLEALYDGQRKVADYLMTEVNAAFEKCTGLNRDQVLGKRLSEIFPRFEPSWSEKYAQLADSGQALSFEEYHPALDRWLLVNTRALGAGRIGVTFIDISEQKKLASEMARLDRLNLVGEMAAAIGHEVRNPLTTVRGYLQFFQNKAELIPYTKQLITMIEELDRANAIITEFLSLAKNKSLDLKQGQLNNLLGSLFPLLQAEAFRLGHDIQLEAGDIPEFKFDENELRQMVLNLARNGLEAMSPGGILILRTFFKDDSIFFEVKDNGQGIPTEILKKLGTPFLTSKESGVGLGLPVSYQISARHGAKIDVDTSEQGTTFSVRFKVAKA